MSDALFDLPPVEPPPTLSPGQRLTIRNANLIANGYHPATRQPLAGTTETCGTCSHHAPRTHNAKTFHKCDLVKFTRGPGTDIRVSWPACTRWEPIA